MQAPFVSTPMQIEPQWIDYNGHFNMAYYNVLFDRFGDQLFDVLGIGRDYVENRAMSCFTAEIHVCYLRELHVDATVTVTMQLLEHDDKRLRFFQELRHSDGWLSATSEVILLHVDMTQRKTVPFPPDRLAVIEQLQAAHAALPWPERAGRSIQIKRKSAGNMPKS